MPSNLDRRLTAIEATRTARRSMSDYSDAELVDMIHGRRLTPDETASYLRKFERQAQAMHAKRRAESEAMWDRINDARLSETQATRQSQGLHANDNEGRSHVHAN